jgi:hypothetical protein
VAASPGSLITQRETLLWLACILLASQLFLPHGVTTGPPPEFPLSLLSRSVFFYLAWYVVITLILASEPDQPASRSDMLMVLAVSSLNLVPIIASSWLATTSLGALLLVTHRDDRKLQAAAAVLLALAFNGYWGPKIFNIFGYYILRADAILVGAALAATQPGMEWHETIVGRPDGHSVLIYSPCSSFHNISLGLLCWVSITKLVRPTWVPADLAVAMAACTAVVLFNATRLYLMALSSDHYAYWHGGPGEQLISLATTMVVLAICLWGALRLGRSQ